ncbi:hypothetical protein [Ahrensia kielensis]|uniref:hypothetical protein n=1 Tax=Ahrensia kielensis TaxID=76980 RepID=UPI00036A64ED|nr:hypothetical protein [Ahrensia kielensis]
MISDVTVVLLMLGYGMLHCAACIVWLVVRLVKRGASKAGSLKQAIALPLAWFAVGLIVFVRGYVGLAEFGTGMGL